MDVYSNNRMLDWEANRRVAELRAMATKSEVEEPGANDEPRAEPFTNFGRTWRSLFQRTNHGYKSA